MANPFLTLNEYVPDGEPHVFGDRVYLYGSHDREGGKRFCERDYVVYSAPVTDMENWICHGISYYKKQDPRSIENNMSLPSEDKSVDYYAPDCVKGNDGRYYLYYVAMGPNTKNFGPMSVAVSERPEGPFEYLGDIQYKDGSPVLKYLTNDPAVINDNGKIYLYYGWGLARDFRNKLFSPILNFVQSKLFDRSIKEIKSTEPSILSCAVVELEADMMTVKQEPQAVLDSKTTADKKSLLYHHAFYEAPSIRKFGDWYYLIYSSGENHELAYAMSKYPDRDFEYRGVLISNCDLGYQGNKQRLAPAGTIHGSVECINGNYYVFYHRCTHNTDFSRQACMEPISMHADGTFSQVEITTQGAGAPITAKGDFPASICCNLFHRNLRRVQGNGHEYSQPNITHDENGQYITAISNGTVIGYKYFMFNGESTISVTVRKGSGEMLVFTDLEKAPVAVLELKYDNDWKESTAKLKNIHGKNPLYFVYNGKGKMELLRFSLK